ncbi:MAG: DUF6582 domain-containing protein, partial [Candidatus Binataceae bacterium]
EIDMDKKELEELLKSSLKPVADQVAALSNDVTALKAGSVKLEANQAMREKVAPHATALRNCAAAMEAAGIGLDSNRGHVRVLHHMAASMEAEAASGKLPHIYSGYDLHHSAELRPAEQPKLEENPVIKGLVDAVAAVGTQLKDLSAKAFTNSTAPDKKTVSKDTLELLAKGGINEAPKEPMNEHHVDKMLEAAGITSMNGRIAAKLQLTKDGVMARSH